MNLENLTFLITGLPSTIIFHRSDLTKYLYNKKTIVIIKAYKTHLIILSNNSAETTTTTPISTKKIIALIANVAVNSGDSCLSLFL